MSIDHIRLPVPTGQVDAEVTFLLAAFSHLGVKECMRPMPNVVGMGKDSPNIWVSDINDQGEPSLVSAEGKVTGTHLAMSTDDRKDVDTFHEAGSKAGGVDNGKPGVRAMYHPTYYGAFLISPAGHNIEVVTHRPEA